MSDTSKVSHSAHIYADWKRTFNTSCKEEMWEVNSCSYNIAVYIYSIYLLLSKLMLEKKKEKNSPDLSNSYVWVW